MTNLIVAVIAIFVMILLAIAVIWYGGSVFSESSQRAIYAQNVNAASQIDAAMSLYRSVNNGLPNLTNEALLNFLKEKEYLKDVPDGAWTINSTQLYKALDNIEQCVAINKYAGKNISDANSSGGCPSCSDENYKKWPGCTLAY